MTRILNAEPTAVFAFTGRPLNRNVNGKNVNEERKRDRSN